jgi:two-component system, NarL family, response regulator LiaR
MLHAGGRAGIVLPVRPISLLVVDDDQVFADALQARLSVEDDFGPVVAAYGTADALGRMARGPADVAIVDYTLGDGTGVELAGRLQADMPATRVIILSATESLDPVVDALIAGVRGWLPKMIDLAHLVAAIRGVDAGEMWVDPALLGVAMPALLARILSPPKDPLAGLTKREREVLECMIDGLTAAQIGRQLNVSANTVRTHTQNLMAKLGAHSSLEVVTLALRGRHHDSRSDRVGR